MTDLDMLLPAIAAGDADAFGRWVAGCEARLRASLSRFAAHVDVEAVLQETLLRVWQVAPRVEPDGRPEVLLRFAIRVARNTAISELRKLGSSQRLVEQLAQRDDEATEATAPDPLLRRVIALCREKLSGKPRAAFEARLSSHGLRPDRHLAAELGMKLNTFLQNFGRARRGLEECLQKNGVNLGELL